MSIKTNIKLEQALTDIFDIKSRLQALELAYSERYRHNDFIPVSRETRNDFTAAPPMMQHEVKLEVVTAPKKRRRRTKGVDKRTKAYKESRNNIKNEAQPAESR